MRLRGRPELLAIGGVILILALVMLGLTAWLAVLVGRGMSAVGITPSPPVVLAPTIPSQVTSTSPQMPPPAMHTAAPADCSARPRRRYRRAAAGNEPGEKVGR
jgi:hypothetical protein